MIKHLLVIFAFGASVLASQLVFAADLSFSDSVTGGRSAASTLPGEGRFVGGTSLSYGDDVPKLDNSALTSPEGLSMGEPVPTTGGAPTSSPRPRARPSAAQQAAASREREIKAVQEYVKPTITGSFSLGHVNSDNEANLYIGNDNGPNNVVYRVIRVIGMLVGTLAILLYIVAGYFMIVSQGDENSLSKGKNIAIYTSLGLVLVFTAYIIVQLVMGLMYYSG